LSQSPDSEIYTIWAQLIELINKPKPIGS
jgi:hypothetical protein